LSDFLAMGGYAAFVWPAYGVSVVALAVMVGTTLRAHSRAKRRLRDLGRG
jgi:heme exporter protein D